MKIDEEKIIFKNNGPHVYFIYILHNMHVWLNALFKHKFLGLVVELAPQPLRQLAPRVVNTQYVLCNENCPLFMEIYYCQMSRSI